MMHIFYLNAMVGEIIRQVLGHLLRQRCDQHALAPATAGVDLAQQVLDLPFHRLDDDTRVQQARGADDLFHDLCGLCAFKIAGRGRNEHRLVQLRLKLLEFERAVVKCRRQAEAEVHKAFFAGVIAAVHGAQLGQHHMALVHKQQEILGEIIQQCCRRGTGRTARQNSGVVLDALAGAHFGKHLNVVIGALGNALGLQQLPLPGESLHLPVQLVADICKARAHFIT